MSSDTVQTRRPTKTQVLAWLGQALRTWKWDAVVAYDSTVLNQVLWETYASRIAAGSYIPSINTSIVLVENKSWMRIQDYTFDAPRLSFEATTLENSLATMTMHAISGSHMQVEQQGTGPRYITRITDVHPLQRTRLTARIPLAMAPGTANSAGSMQISLCRGIEFDLAASEIADHRRLMGSHIKILFDELDDDQKMFEVASVGQGGANDIINPETFGLRARCAPGADQRSSPNFGAGEVMMFIAMKGSSTGLLPADPATPFLVPEESSCTILLSNHLMTRQLVARGQSTWTGTAPEVEYLHPGQGAAGPIRKVSIVGPAQVVHPELSISLDGEHLRWTRIISDLALSSGEAGFSLTKVGEVLEIAWEARVPYRLSNLQYGTRHHVCNHTFKLKRTFAVALAQKADLTLQPRAGDVIEELMVRTVARDDTGSQPMFSHTLYEYASKCLLDTVDHFASQASSLQAHKLLMFPHGEVALHAHTVHFPNDVAMFCDLPAPAGTFRVTPGEAMIGAGGTVRFSTSTAAHEAAWTVRSTDGAGAACGAIDPDGHYTAPLREEVRGSLVQVIVTATTADGRHSSGLVTVLAQDVIINPVVFLADSRRMARLHVSALDDAPVSVELASGCRGEVRCVHGPTEGEPPAYWYRAAASARGEFHVDRLVVRNLRSGSTAHAYVLVNTEAAPDRIDVVPLGPAGFRLTLHAMDSVVSDVQWTLHAGSGELVDGVYRPSKNEDRGFAVLSGSATTAAGDACCGWIILPVPMLECAGQGGTVEQPLTTAA